MAKKRKQSKTQRKKHEIKTPPSVEGASGGPVEGACRLGHLEQNITVQEIMNNDMKKDGEYNYMEKKEAERIPSSRDKNEECQESIQRSLEVDGETMKEMQKVNNKHYSETVMDGAVGGALGGAVGALGGAVGGASEGAVGGASESIPVATMFKRLLDAIEKREAEAKEMAKNKQRRRDKYKNRESSQRSREADVETMNEMEKVRKYHYSAIAEETPPYGLGAEGGATYNLQSHLESLCESFAVLNNVAKRKPEPLPKEVAGEMSTTAKNMRPYYEEKQKDESLGECKKDPETLAPPSKNPELDAVKADVKALRQSFMGQHQCFVFKLYDYLFKCFGLQENASSVPSGGGEYYDDFVGQAVLSLCALYGDFWRIQFDALGEKLFDLDYFILHCAAMPIVRDVFFFYNYLMRVAVIFEMALHCFEDGLDYFFIAKTCTYQFVDFLYFRDEGGWSALKTAAAVIAIATRPLRFFINCPKVNAGSFADVIGALEEFKSEGVINITELEFFLLKAVDEKFKLLPDVNDMMIGPEWKHLKVMLMAYFRNCMPKGTTITFNTSDFDLDNFIIMLDHLVDDTDVYKKCLKHFDTIPGTVPEASFSDTTRLRFLWYVLQTVRGNQKRKRKAYSTCCTLFVERGMGIVMPMTLIDRLRQSFPQWKLNTTKVPSSRRFVSFRKAYADKLIELYHQVLPSFITNYCLQDLSPDSESKSSDSKSPTIVLIRESYYKQRKEDLRFPDSTKRMYGGKVINDDYLKGEIKTDSLRLVPMDVETLLDSYIGEHDAGKLLPEVEVRTFAVPEMPEFGSGTVWYVMGPIEDNSSLPEVFYEIENIVEMFYENGRQRIVKADTDEMTVEMFRLETRTGYIIPVPVNTTEVVPEKPSETRSVDPETSSSKKKKKKRKKN